jgi:hypothetical protein
LKLQIYAASERETHTKLAPEEVSRMNEEKRGEEDDCTNALSLKINPKS